MQCGILKTATKRQEYVDIPDLEYRKDVKHPLYSAEYSGTRSSQTPPISERNIEIVRGWAGENIFRNHFTSIFVVDV